MKRKRIKTNLQSSSALYLKKEKHFNRVRCLTDENEVRKEKKSMTLYEMDKKLKQKSQEIIDSAKYAIKTLSDGSKGIYIISKKGNLVAGLN